jgi:hypothetical protein
VICEVGGFADAPESVPSVIPSVAVVAVNVVDFVGVDGMNVLVKSCVEMSVLNVAVPG